MELRGICSICGRTGTMHSCTMCGALVCSDCYVPEKKVCKMCAKETPL